MIDLRALRDDPTYREGAVAKGATADTLDRLLADDAERRQLLAEVERLRADANAASKDIGRADPHERDAKIAAAGELKARVGDREAVLEAVSTRVDEAALAIPNPAHPSVPTGTEEAFEVIDVVGGQPSPPPLDHADYGDRMGWTDAERGAAVSGSRFAYLRAEAVLLELALVQWTMQKLVGRGFTPIVPPVLVREDMMVDAGFFPTDRNQVYELEKDELFLVGTAEVPLAGIHRGERLDATTLPLRYVGFSSCFRREAGTYGKDTRGIFRVHQFDKVEMFIWADPEQSWAEHELLLEIEREILDQLGLPYRVINVASGDLGAAAAKKYDCEVWLPSEGQYREITSCSNYTDFSARRLGTRVKGDRGSEFAHTLNGTACAVGRMLVFLMEHAQQDDGSFVVPEVLRPYCGLDLIVPPAAE
ncbi:MAG: serine--tRNA ligase [Acidimicrobiia bacterium]|nr:serine--tRNA ligase [Acidimicrobiia bacterium]MDH5235983.1 serine--tRNA ligase [Acidimicrobiia bacterium]